MKTNLQIITKSFSSSAALSFRMCAYALIVLLLLSSCSSESDPKDKDQQGTEVIDPKEPVVNNPKDALSCKKKPSKVVYGIYRFDIKYNAKDQPIELSTYNQDLGTNTVPGTKTIYTITYNDQGKPSKVSKVIGDKAEGSYVLEYGASGILSKQSEYNAAGTLLNYTLTEYTAGGLLSKITTHTEGDGIEVSSTYEYANGNLIKKSSDNLYDAEAKEYYKADYTYTYEDKELKVKPVLEGTLGLRVIADLAKSVSLQFQSRVRFEQFFHLSEGNVSKNILKNVQIIAQRYNTKDTTKIDYTHEYDADGYPTYAKGALKNTIRSKYTSSFGAPTTTTTPHSNSFQMTIDYKCE